MPRDLTDDMKEAKEEIRKFLNEERCNQRVLMRFKKHITDLVIRNHFSEFRDYDLLRSLTNEKFTEILNDGELDLDGTITSYFYTGFQQKIWNHFNKQNIDEYPVGEQEDENQNKQDGVAHKVVSIEEAEEEIRRQLEEVDFGDERVERLSENENSENHLKGLKLFEKFYHEGGYNE